MVSVSRRFFSLLLRAVRWSEDITQFLLFKVSFRSRRGSATLRPASGNTFKEKGSGISRNGNILILFCQNVQFLLSPGEGHIHQVEVVNIGMKFLIEEIFPERRTDQVILVFYRNMANASKPVSRGIAPQEEILVTLCFPGSVTNDKRE